MYYEQSVVQLPTYRRFHQLKELRAIYCVNSTAFNRPRFPSTEKTATLSQLHILGFGNSRLGERMKDVDTKQGRGI